jgi:alkylation response protein AidB-like acyl-CoA dehydrogenase
MDLGFSSGDNDFRLEIRAALADMVPPDMAQRTRRGFHSTKEDLKLWNSILHSKGWSAPHWLPEYGGTGWSPLRAHIFEEECAAADAPFLSYFGLRLVGPLIYTYGNASHKQRFLGDILSGKTLWCQGFSEPSSGSDLASVKTTAVRSGDHYLVNGQKLWTTEAHFADKMFCLVRTNPHEVPQKGGVSILLFDLNSPQVVIRPIITIDGGHSVNEVFFDNLRVPACDVVGVEGQGWDHAKFMLANERTANSQVPRCKRDLVLLRQIAAREAFGGKSMLDQADITLRIAQLEIDLYGLEWSLLRELLSSNRSQAIASGLKILGSEIQQRISELAADLVGPKALAFYGPNDAPFDGEPEYVPGLAARQLFLRAATIYAGANEVQRDLIAKQVFGLRAF